MTAPIPRPRPTAPRPRRAAARTKKKGSPLLGIVVSFVAFLVVGAVLRSLRGEGGASVADAGAWHAVAVGDVRMEAPVDVPALSDAASVIPASVRDIYVSCRMSQAQSADHGFGFVLTEMVARPDVPVSVEGAVQGAITNAALSTGALAPLVTPPPVQVGPLVGYEASYVVSTKKPPIHLSGIAVGRGQTVWCIMVVHTGSRAAPDAQRLLRSVRIADAPHGGGR